MSSHIACMGACCSELLAWAHGAASCLHGAASCLHERRVQRAACMGACCSELLAWAHGAASCLHGRMVQRAACMGAWCSELLAWAHGAASCLHGRMVQQKHAHNNNRSSFFNLPMKSSCQDSLLSSRMLQVLVQPVCPHLSATSHPMTSAEHPPLLHEGMRSHLPPLPRSCPQHNIFLYLPYCLG